VRTAILGSCVTRDAFSTHEETLGKPDWYFARSGLPSAMSELIFHDVDVSTMESPFQRAVVSADLDGSFARFLPQGEFDLLVYDPVDERFPLLVADSGAIATRSSEFTRAVADVESCVRAEPHSEAYYELWEPAWQQLVEATTRAGTIDRLRVNQVYWAHRLDGPGEFPSIYPAEKVRRANEFLERLYSRMLEDLPPHRFVSVCRGRPGRSRRAQVGDRPVPLRPCLLPATVRLPGRVCGRRAAGQPVRRSRGPVHPREAMVGPGRIVGTEVRRSGLSTVSIAWHVMCAPRSDSVPRVWRVVAPPMFWESTMSHGRPPKKPTATHVSASRSFRPGMNA
jgi:hypothetical protein